MLKKYTFLAVMGAALLSAPAQGALTLDQAIKFIKRFNDQPDKSSVLSILSQVASNGAQTQETTSDNAIQAPVEPLVLPDRLQSLPNPEKRILVGPAQSRQLASLRRNAIRRNLNELAKHTSAESEQTTDFLLATFNAMSTQEKMIVWMDKFICQNSALANLGLKNREFTSMSQAKKLRWISQLTQTLYSLYMDNVKNISADKAEAVEKALEQSLANLYELECTVRTNQPKGSLTPEIIVMRPLEFKALIRPLLHS